MARAETAKTVPMKFSIRELMLVTVIVALVLGWWVDRSRLAKDAEAWRAASVLVKSVQQKWHDGWLKGERWEIPEDFPKRLLPRE